MAHHVAGRTNGQLACQLAVGFGELVVMMEYVPRHLFRRQVSGLFMQGTRVLRVPTDGQASTGSASRQYGRPYV